MSEKVIMTIRIEADGETIYAGNKSIDEGDELRSINISYYNGYELRYHKVELNTRIVKNKQEILIARLEEQQQEITKLKELIKELKMKKRGK